MNKLKYRILGEEQYDEVTDLLGTLLKSRGVNNVKELINVDKSSVLNPFRLENMEKGVELLAKHVKNKNKIHILIDCDCDGDCSATVLWLYLHNHFNIDCTYSTHNGKQHGIILSELENLDCDLLIVPDGGSSDYKQHKILKDKGIDILVLDHHEADKFSEDAIVINHSVKGSSYPYKSLAGVGVVYKFCQALDIKYSTDYADNYLDLVALGNIADSVDLRDLETRYLTLQGIELLKRDKILAEKGENTFGNKFIRAIVEKKKDRDLKKINITSLGWKIAPMLNAIARVGKMEEKLDMFRALIEIDDPRMYQGRRYKGVKPEPIEVTLQEDMARICSNAQSRQNNSTKKIVDTIEEKISLDNNNDKIIVVNATDCIEDGGVTGLIANKIASKHKKPVLLLREQDSETFGGSARNFNMSPIDDMRGLINQTEFKGMGHKGAFGIKIGKDKLSIGIQQLKELTKNIEMQGVYSVDYKIPVGRLKDRDVLNVGKLKEYWGNTLPEPMFLISNISMDVKDIILCGSRRNFLRFKKGNLTFIKSFVNEDYLNRIILRNKNGFGKNPNKITLDIIGTFEVNEYQGRNYPQINIIDFYSREKEEIIF